MLEAAIDVLMARDVFGVAQVSGHRDGEFVVLSVRTDVPASFAVPRSTTIRSMIAQELAESAASTLVIDTTQDARTVTIRLPATGAE